MGIEAIGAIVKGVATSVARAPAVEAGGIARGISALERTAPLGKVGWSLINEGPVAPIFLENTMPISFDRVNPIRVISNPFKENIPVTSSKEPTLKAPTFELLSVEEVMKEAKHWLGIPESEVEPQAKRVAARVWETTLASPGKPWEATNPLDWVQPVVKAKNILERGIGLQPKTATRVSNQIAQAVSAPITQEVEEVIEEKLITDQPEETVKETEEEEIIRDKRLYLVDERALDQRVREADQAVDKSKKEAQRLGYGEKILGFLVAKFMSKEHAGNRSQIVQPRGPDGTIPITEETIRAIQEFNSKKEVEAIVLQNRPVKIGKDGERVREEEVRKVLNNRIVKASHKPVEIMEKRIVKKRIQVYSGQTHTPAYLTEETKVEPTLEDLNLSEVFQQNSH